MSLRVTACRGWWSGGVGAAASRVCVCRADPPPQSALPFRHANGVFLGCRALPVTAREQAHDGGVGTRRAPSGLKTAGRALWREVNASYGLNPAESLMLVQLCRCADRIEAIEAELDGADLVVPGSTGQPACHPLLGEWRAQARVAESLARSLALPMPGEDVGRRRSPSAREAAAQRWGRGHGVA